ncbi:MAG: hypothetical protein RIT45_1607 [Pseudomonadota bacterium]|jgi:signal peptidase II
MSDSSHAPRLVPPSMGLRLGAYAFAVFVLVTDQWSKQAAVEHLASPDHPMIVDGDGARDAVALLVGHGLDEAEARAAVERRVVWRLAPAGSVDLAAPARESAGQLFVREGTGKPAPRRLRPSPDAPTETLGEAMQREWRVDAAQASALAPTLLQAEGVWTEPTGTVPAGTSLALLERERPVIDGFMRYVYAENPGAAWSFLRDAPVGFRTAFFSVIAILASLAMILAIWTGWMGSAAGTIALGGILGGAVGNLIDRNRYTVVVDFVLNYVGEHRWPVWNIADAGITVGVAAILIEALLGMRTGGSTQDASADAA